MPEGPEVRRQTDWLSSLIGEKKFLGIECLDGCKYDIDINRFNSALHKPLKRITCKGKWFFFEFDIELNNKPNDELNNELNNDKLELNKEKHEGLWIAVHHGMGGHWADKKRKGDKNYHIRMFFADIEVNNGKEKARDMIKLYINNARFGQFEVLTTEEAHDKLDSLANGFIGEYILTEEQWTENLKRFTNRKSLYSIWEDQEKLCSGIGNYLRSEIMYEAKLYPFLTLGQLSEQQKIDLYKIAKKVVERFYSGEKVFKVYGQDKDSEGNEVVKTTKNNRKIWWVKEVQIKL